MTGADVIREVSFDLNDQEPGHEYTHWTVEMLQSYMREALIYVGARKQHWFSEMVVIPVKPTTDWQKACDCSEIMRIIGESDSHGHITKYLHGYLDDSSSVWGGNVVCNPSGSLSSVASYSIRNTDRSWFKLYPAPDLDKQTYVVAECYVRPDAALDSHVPDEAVAIVKQWMLFRAMLLDSENNSSIMQVAAQHRQTFMDLLRIELAEAVANDSVRAKQNSADN